MSFANLFDLRWQTGLGWRLISKEFVFFGADLL
jgi:hypothetical protein